MLSPIEEVEEFFSNIASSDTPLVKKLRVKRAYEILQEEVEKKNSFLTPIRANSWLGKSSGYQDISLIGDDMAVVLHFEEQDNIECKYYFGAYKKDNEVVLSQPYPTYDQAVLACLALKYANENNVGFLIKCMDMQ